MSHLLPRSRSRSLLREQNGAAVTATVAESIWLPIRDADPRGFGHYMRHYSSKKARAGREHKRWQFNGRRYIGNGEHLSLLTVDGTAHFAWRWQKFRKDEQTGIECCIFRNEGPHLSSDLIREADSVAWERWPGVRHFTFVDPAEIRSTNPGYCFLMAGWTRLEKRSKSGKVVLELML